MGYMPYGNQQLFHNQMQTTSNWSMYMNNNQIQSHPVYPVYHVQPVYPVQAVYPVQPVYPVYPIQPTYNFPQNSQNLQ